MMKRIPVPFPPGEITTDVDGLVCVTLPPGVGLFDSRILAMCKIGERSIDVSSLIIRQVTVEQGDWKLDMLSPPQTGQFPFLIAVHGLEQHAVRPQSTADAPVKVHVHVSCFDDGIERDANQRRLSVRLRPLPAPAVDVILYSRALLEEEGEHPPIDVDFMIVSINARTSEEAEPMTPMAMARNFLALSGGTKAEYTAEQFATAIRYWSVRAMHGGST